MTLTDNTRALLLSYLFPPLPMAEAHVAAKAMGATGWDTMVLCADPGTWNLTPDTSLLSYVDERFRDVQRLRFRGGLTMLRMQWRVPLIGDLPDAFLYKWPSALRTVIALEPQTYDVMVSRSQLHSVHLVGRSVKRRHPELPWIASFSDPWVGSRFVGRNAVTRGINRMLERSVIQTADIVVFTSDHAAESTMQAYPEFVGKTRVIPHSYDPILYPETPIPDGQEGSTLRYVGFFDSERSPEPLFLALQVLLRRRPEFAQSVRVEIVGSLPQRALRTPAALALPRGLVRVIPPVSYADSLALMRSADLLLVVDAVSKNAVQSTYLPSKLIDYIGAGRPIVALSPEGPAAEVVRDLGGWVAEPQDNDSAATALADALDAVPSCPFPWGQEEARARFHVDRVGAAWRSLITG